MIDGYKVSHRISLGLTGEVYKVTNVVDKKEYALKLASGEAGKLKLQHEVDIYRTKLSQSSSSNVYFVDMISEEVESKRNNQHYFIMELVNGDNWSDYRKNCVDKKCNMLTCCQFMLEGVYILEELHKLGVYHGDVKPTNLVLCDKRWTKQSYLICLLYTSPSPRDRG